MGRGIGRWFKLAAILSPVIIGEFVKNPEVKWRAVRITSIISALLFEGLHETRLKKQRDEAREQEELCSILR